MTRIQIKRGTAASWTSANPILSQGEMGYETDTKKIKVGDGTTAWSSLVYSYFGVGSFTQAVGNGSATTITVTHNLNTRNVVVSVKESSTYAEVLCDVTATSANAVTLTFATAPTAGQYIVTVIGDNVPVALANTSPFADNAFTLRDATDNTKQAQFSTSAITTGTTRTYTLPDANTTLVGTGFTTTATAAGTTTLTVASTPIQEFTGTTIQTVALPTTSVPAGAQYTIINNSTGLVTVQSSSGAQIHVLASATEAIFTALVATPTTAAHWEDSFFGTNFAAGKKLTVANTLTFQGTDGTSFYFPSMDGTLASQNDDLRVFTRTTTGTIGIGSIELGHATDTTLSRSAAGILAVEGVAQVNLSAAQTLTNKRITPRIGTTASSATPSIDIDSYDQYNITALAVAITGVTVTGTPTDGQKLLVRIKDNATARAITWGASFVASGAAALLTTTAVSKTHLSGFIYDSTAAKWVCVAADSAGY